MFRLDGVAIETLSQPPRLCGRVQRTNATPHWSGRPVVVGRGDDRSDGSADFRVVFALTFGASACKSDVPHLREAAVQPGSVHGSGRGDWLFGEASRRSQPGEQPERERTGVHVRFQPRPGARWAAAHASAAGDQLGRARHELRVPVE